MVEIIQGSNSPIVLEFEDDVSSAEKIEASLNDRGVEYKHWNKADILVEESTITLPLTESETMKFEPGKVYLDVKMLDADEVIIFYGSATLKVIEKFDKTKLTED